ncbi:MAG: branched-chain amino acid transport system permease protein, partial [Candidatus Eremiobacteraeota bacterium]|nr:branched-chain amino acid transport system permease protein [Candidatus Eremiobacteraeota bacterium]
MSGLVEVQLLNGIVQGMIYALVAAGLTLIFGMLDIPNFAHGAFYALGAYVAFTVVSSTGNFWLAIAVVPVVVAALGLLVDAVAMRRLARAGHVYQILFTLGLVLIVQEAIVLIWGANPTSVDVPAALGGGVPLGAVSFPFYRLFLVGAAALVIGAVWIALERTKYGAIIRAGIDDPEMVDCIGIDVQRLFTIVFGIGVGLAALAGALILPIRGGQPSMGNELMATSFAVVVIGGLGSYLGAVVGGVFVGLTQAVMT